MKRACTIIAILAIAALLSISVKVFYLGFGKQSVGQVGDYEIVECETWHSIGSFRARDARGGFYRIYDKHGSKVFELFSDSFAFDVVITSATQAEFQLNSGATEIWTRPTKSN